MSYAIKFCQYYEIAVLKLASENYIESVKEGGKKGAKVRKDENKENFENCICQI